LARSLRPSSNTWKGSSQKREGTKKFRERETGRVELLRARERGPKERKSEKKRCRELQEESYKSSW
jgi:hypothetical protein